MRYSNILVTSSSRKAPLVRAVRKAAKRLDPNTLVYAGDIDPDAPTRYVADGFWQMPRTRDDSIEELLRGCIERGIGAVFPTRDGELAFWASHAGRFQDADIDVFVSPIESVRTCLDKLAFAQLGQQLGLPFIPAGLQPDDAGPGPYVVKERFGAGSHALGLNLDRAAALQHAAGLDSPIYQPFVAGREISVDAWMDKARKIKGLVLRRRDVVSGGESQVTTTFQDSDIELATARILDALKLRGPVVLQALIDPKGKLHVIECNSRFGGASTAAIEVGLDIFYWSLLERAGANLDKHPFMRASGEVRQVRLPSDIYIHDPRI